MKVKSMESLVKVIVVVLWLVLGVIIGLTTDFFIDNSFLVICLAGALLLVVVFFLSFGVLLVIAYIEEYARLFANADPKLFKWHRFIRGCLKYPWLELSKLFMPGHRHDSVHRDLKAVVCKSCFWVGRRRDTEDKEIEYSKHKNDSCPICKSTNFREI